MSSTWSSGVGKFVKKDPEHGNLWRRLKHWVCKVGLCNFDKCKCDCHDKGDDKKEGETQEEGPKPKVRKKVFDASRGGFVWSD